MHTPAQQDLTRTFLVILIIAVLIVGSLWTLMPFLGSIIWAGTIVVATWPLLIKVERLAGGRRSLATAVMTVVMLAIQLDLRTQLTKVILGGTHLRRAIVLLELGNGNRRQDPHHHDDDHDFD